MADTGGSAPRKGGARAAGGKAKTAARKPARKAAKPTKAQQSRMSAAARKREAREVKRRAEELAKAAGGEVVPVVKGAAAVVENAELYVAVFADWAAGMDYPQLSERHGLSPRRCQEVVSEMRQARLATMRLGDPMFGLRVAQDLVLRWSASIAGYAELAAEADQDSVRLGAMRRRDEALESFTALMQELGYLPKHLGTLRIQEDFLGLIDTLLDRMHELGVPDEVQRQLVESVEMRVVAAREGRLRLAASGDVIDVQGEEVAA